jgi:competence protein ComEC
VPHHGSKTSSGDAFLQAVQPRWALVQAGYRNRFGHPAPAVLERYARHGIAVVRSDACGAAWWSSAQPDTVRCEREAARRAWTHRLP